MLCESCGTTEAKVRVVEIVNGAKQAKLLCQACADAQGAVIEPPAFQLSGAPMPGIQSDVLAPMLEAMKAGVAKSKAKDAHKKCPKCGITLAEFKKRGRLGCPHDYEAFAEELASLVQKIHGAAEHRGRGPGRPPKKKTHRQKVEALRRELDEAIRAEQYETAAALRDQLKKIDPPVQDGDDA